MTDYLHALPPGYRIEEYELVRVLGSGGFGITYLSYDHHLDKATAIKEYLPNDLAVRADNNSVLPKSTQDKADYEWGLARFLNEAQTLARFDHRHIIKIHRFFRAHGTGYSVMEYAEGETLSEMLQRMGTLTESELKRILFPILDGLEAVHEADFLHRDIKPSNIVIRDDGSPVLIDFGSARQAVAGKSRSVTAIVTPGYAPIEQYSVKGHQGPWTDIYGLGAVCYRCLTGEPPDDATERLREDPLVPVSKRCKGKANASLLNAIDRALRVDEGERPQGVAEWRQALAGDGKSGKGATGSAHKPATRPAKSSGTAPAGVSWSDRAMEAVIVVLLGAIAWPIWQLYGGRPEVDKTVAVVEQQAGTRGRMLTPEEVEELDKKGGDAFFQGDYMEAVRWYRQAAEQGHPGAQVSLGMMYDSGRGVAEDNVQAVRWYRRAVKQGHAGAQLMLGGMYAKGEGVAEDDTEAARWFRQAAEQGLADAQFMLGAMYDSGRGVAEDDAQAVKWYRQAAEQGDAGAQLELGMMYADGEGVAQDVTEAMGWFRQAAEQGHAAAEFMLGMMYASGLGVMLDDVEAMRWFRRAAGQGHAGAQLELGLMYDSGRGVAEDDAQAVKWYRQAAEQGDAGAQLELGMKYAFGRGVAQDDVEAMRWFRRAAEQGQAMAQAILGQMYDTGRGVAEDDAEAVKWYRKAAEQGLAKAQLELAQMYASDGGVAEDNVTAYMWFNIVGLQGIKEAMELRDMLAESMTAADISEAQRRARICLESNYQECD